jgi:hypothetical protein
MKIIFSFENMILAGLRIRPQVMIRLPIKTSDRILGRRKIIFSPENPIFISDNLQVENNILHLRNPTLS